MHTNIKYKERNAHNKIHGKVTTKLFKNISNFSEKFEYSLNVQTHNLTFIL